MRKKAVPVGIEDFKELIQEGYYYIDKTLLIDEMLMNKSKVTLFTRPRRFGKTLNMSMLKYFFDVKDKEENKPQNKRQHPVHSLPPRERLAKYYEYLASFNEKIQHEQDGLNEAQREGVSVSRLKLEQLEQRRARCLEAIEMLEEYLICLEKQK